MKKRLKYRRDVLGLLLVAGLLVPAAGTAQTSDECLECHADEELVTTAEDGTERSLQVDAAVFGESVHGGFDCVDCHASITELPHDRVDAVACADCHPAAAEDYGESMHALAREDGNVLSPTCNDCHGKHDITPSNVATSHTSSRNTVAMCGHCHSDQRVIASFIRKGFDPVTDYEASVHAQALREDPDVRVANCVTCHSAHAIVPPYSPKSTFGKLQLPGTCGQCHTEESEAYQESIHWQAVRRGYFESPVCNDCHSEHRIMSPKDDTALTHPSLVSSSLCASCHSNQTQMASFGLDADRLTTYNKTYHGLAVLRGSPEAANCVSCHEMHAIRSPDDPLSTTHPDNLQATCGGCHGAVDTSFTAIAVHPSHQRERNPVAWVLKVIYMWLIPLTIGGMLIHNLVIHSFYVRRRYREQKMQPQVRRFQTFEVYEHMGLILSFMLLVVTGFALKFPDAGWVAVLAKMGLNEALRSTVHRVAGGVLVALGLLQLFYLLAGRGRRDLKALMPARRDLRDLRENMAYHLERQAAAPRFGRFDYMEKAEYLALIWGTALMAATGFILWFPELALRLFPVWIFEAAEVVHYYEAWLATLAILVWHWYFVVFHPESYPMRFTWLTGKVTRTEQELHHPLEEGVVTR